jgi:hypothetical protein
MPFSLGFWAAAGGGAAGGDAMELISTTILGTSSASVTLSGIPATYKHLQVRFTVRDDYSGGTQAPFRMVVNADTGANYSRHWLRGDGSSVQSNSGSSENSAWLNYTLSAGSGTNYFTGGVLDILDYASTSKNKTTRVLIGSYGYAGGHTQISLSSSGWFSTSAITSLQFYSTLGNLVAGTRFSLYGIKGA